MNFANEKSRCSQADILSTGTMRFILFLCSPLILLINGCSCCQKSDGDQKWTSIFNGNDLSGWQVACLEADKGKEFWKVVDGAIECDSIGRKDHAYVWLVAENEYSDFELKLQFQGFRDSPGNSGIQIRSRYDESPEAPNGGWLDGPQVDIHPPVPWRIGLIYDETREEKRWIHPSLTNWEIEESQGQPNNIFKYSDEGDGWNDMRILCQGNQIKVWLNGDQITDYDGTGVLDNEAHVLHNVGTTGHIALQLHAKDSLKIRFRELFVRELP